MSWSVTFKEVTPALFDEESAEAAFEAAVASGSVPDNQKVRAREQFDILVPFAFQIMDAEIVKGEKFGIFIGGHAVGEGETGNESVSITVFKQS